MPTLGSILSNATTGLRAQQAALSVVSHNVANATTEGYTRQRAVMSSNPPLRTPDGVFGTGVAVVDVQQVRDALLDASYRTETGDASEHRTRSEMLGRVETILGEPTETGLDATLDAFLSAWSDLASNPTSPSHRIVVRERGRQLAVKLQELAGSVAGIREEVETRLRVGVDRVNALTSTVARLNREIVSVESDGQTAGDLRDSRSRALDELAGLIPVTVVERTDGSVGVASSGINVVDGAYTSALQVASAGGIVGFEIVGRSGLLRETGGSLGGLLEVLNSDLTAVQGSLDDLTEALVAEVNALHMTGTGPDGTTGVAFFDPAGTTAWTISLSAAVEAAPTCIAAGTADALGAYRAGANNVAQAIATLRDDAMAALGVTPGEHIRALVSSVGLAVRSSRDAADVHQTLADQAGLRRESLSGVSVDEELVQLIQYQSAYQASAKVISATDEMIRSLLAI